MPISSWYARGGLAAQKADEPGLQGGLLVGSRTLGVACRCSGERRAASWRRGCAWCRPRAAFRSGLDDRPLHRPEEHSEDREATGRVLRHQPHWVRRLPRRHHRIHLRTNVEDLASDANIVVIAVLLRRFTDVPLSPLADRIVIDVMNYWPPVDGLLPEFQHSGQPSSVLVRDALASTTRLLKTFNHLRYHQTEDWRVPPEHPTGPRSPCAATTPAPWPQLRASSTASDSTPCQREAHGQGCAPARIGYLRRASQRRRDAAPVAVVARAA
jgi:hypothetical protein